VTDSENVPTDKAYAHQFLGKQSGLDKAAVPHSHKNSQPLDFSFFELVYGN
jgi:hypothetical protein